MHRTTVAAPALAGAVLAALAALAALAVPASAHVSVNPNTATKGGFAKLAFRVPNERANAGTTKLLVSFPTDHPIASVSVRPKAGWTYKVTTSKLATPIQAHGEPVTEAVSQIEWTGGRIAPGEFDEFEVSAGPLPEAADTLVFKAVQTYSDGTVVRWIDVRTPGGPAPDHPAPVLTLTAAGATPSPAASPATPASPASTAPAVTPTVDTGPVEPAAAAQDAEDKATVATWLAVAGLVLGLAGVGTGLAAARRRPA
jgi:uncharacterized protein YcnI